MAYLGELKIESEISNDDGISKVTFEGGQNIDINSKLLKELVTEEEGKGNITDNINDYFARKFVAELAYYDLDYYFVKSVGIAMEVLSHNLREELIRKTFNCSGGDAINLKKLLTDIK